MSKKYITDRIKAVLDSDLLTKDGRMMALSEISKIALEGYVREVLVQKTGDVVPAIVQDPATAILAIRELSRLDVPDEDSINISINIQEAS